MSRDKIVVAIVSSVVLLLTSEIWTQVPTVKARDKDNESPAQMVSDKKLDDPLSGGQYRWGLDLKLFLGFPRGAFKSNNTRLGVGLDATLWYHLTPIPLLVGINAAIASYGRTRRNVPWSTTIPDVVVEVERSNNYLLVGPVLRIQPIYGIFAPYAEMGGGLSYLYTETAVKDQRTGEKIASSENVGDLTWNIWAGGGLAIVVFPGEYSSSEQRWLSNPVLLSAGIRWLEGGEAEYLTPEDVRVQDGQVHYMLRRSLTGLFVVVIGVELRL